MSDAVKAQPARNYRCLVRSIALTVVLFVPGSRFGQAGQGQVSLAIGTMGPGAALQDLAGNDVELLDYVYGKPTLIEFWASWCENCEALQSQLDDIHTKYGDEVNVVAVAVAVSQSLRRVKRHVAEHGAG